MALVAPLLLLLGVGVADLGRGYAVRVDAANGAEVAARALAKSNPGSQSAANTTAASAARGQDQSAWTQYSCSIPATFGGVANPVLPTAGTNGPIKVYEQCQLTLITPMVKSIVGTVIVTDLAVARADW